MKQQEPSETDTSSLRRLAAAVIKQAHSDLKSPCGKLRQEGIEFFSKQSPWMSMIDISIDFARRRIADNLADAATKIGCLRLKRCSHSLVCPIRNTHYEFKGDQT